MSWKLIVDIFVYLCSDLFAVGGSLDDNYFSPVYGSVFLVYLLIISASVYPVCWPILPVPPVFGTVSTNSLTSKLPIEQLLSIYSTNRPSKPVCRNYIRQTQHLFRLILNHFSVPFRDRYVSIFVFFFPVFSTSGTYI